MIAVTGLLPSFLKAIVRPGGIQFDVFVGQVGQTSAAFPLYKGTGANPKRKYQSDATYNRRITISKVNSKSAFVIITRTAREPTRLLHIVQDNTFIGCIVRVVEPIFSQRFLGSDTSNPILEVEESFISQPNTVDVAVEVFSNGHSKGTFPFSLTAIRLQFSKAMLAHATCSGILCDRRSVKTACCCLDTEAQSSFAISVKMMGKEDVPETHPLNYGETVQSFSLSKLF